MKSTHIVPVLAVLFFLGAAAASAQVNLGVRMGVNSASAAIHLAYGDSYQTERRIGLVAGLAMEFPLAGPLTVQFEPQYAQKGYKLQEDYLGNPLTVVGKLNYIDIPILLKGTVHFGNFSVYGFAGPSIGFRSDVQVAQMFPDSTEISSVDYSVKDFDFTLDAGVGVGIKINPTTTFVADARVSHGLINVDSGEKNDYRSRDMKFMLGMMFGI